MPKQKNPKTRKAFTWRLSPLARTLLIHCSIALLLVGGFVYVLHHLRRHVEYRLAIPAEAPTMVIKHAPPWMSAELAQRIADAARPKQLRSAMDRELLHHVAELLEQNPWVRTVRQVRRAYGKSAGDTIEIDCEYRAPMALVLSRNELIMVDADGFRLPEKFPAAQNPRAMFDADGRVNLRIIEGVGATPPLHDGQKWTGQDLQAGLDLAKLLYNQLCADEIHRINVSNHAGRRSRSDPQLTLLTKHRTEIRWGEPVKLPFHAELSPAEKLERLSKIHQQFGRVDGNHSWLDIRLDKITYPAEESPVAQTR